VDFLDSQGLSILVAAYKRLSEDHCRLRLINPRPQVTQLLKMTGLDTYLNPEPTGPLAAAS
jgi:anti-anti-sigma factor